MPEFRGPKNLHIGGWAESKYDHDAHEYVITLDDAAAKKFRALKDDDKHGFAEAKPKGKASADVEPASD